MKALKTNNMNQETRNMQQFEEIYIHAKHLKQTYNNYSNPVSFTFTYSSISKINKSSLYICRFVDDFKQKNLSWKSLSKINCCEKIIMIWGTILPLSLYRKFVELMILQESDGDNYKYNIN